MAQMTERMPDRSESPSTSDTSPPRLRIEVEWADVTKATGDVFVVGHYIGVLPQNAEWALDCALSRVVPSAKKSNGADEARLVLTDLTRRGAVRGSLGDVMFFPWSGRGHIVLAGMGRLGTFKEPQLRILASSVIQTVGRLIKGAHISMVLIGAGFGNLKVEESVAGLLSGAAAAMKADPTLDIASLRIVEARIDRAYEILQCVQDRLPSIAGEYDVALAVEPEVVERDGTGGVMPIPFGFSWMLAALAQASHGGEGSRLYQNLTALVAELPESLRPGVLAALGRLGGEKNTKRLGSLAFRLGSERPAESNDVADRISFHHDGNFLHSAAITNMTTVATRDLDVRLSWVDRIVDELQAPPVSTSRKTAQRAFRYLVHQDLKEPMRSTDPLVLELDRNMARVPWELISDGTVDAPPLGIRRPVARQLRTAYSPRPGEPALRGAPKALIIGDPDDSLEFALDEAREVAALLREHHIAVELRLGSADELGLGRHAGCEAADLYDIVALLHSGEFDVVHFCGHAQFFPEYPERSGWVFKGELLTPSKLEGIERPPRLVFANACISAGLSPGARPREADGEDAPAGREPGARRPPGDSRLVASLADEFFRRGVEDYIGTAWAVPERPAQLFAVRLYKALLGIDCGHARGNGGGGASLGDAVQIARRALFDHEAEWGEEFGTVWAAYQHYGDPTRRIFHQPANR